MAGTWLSTRGGPRDEQPRHPPFVARPLTPERLAALFDERRELLDGLSGHPEWAEREADLFDLLRSVLNVGDLRLLRIDRHTSATVLEKIVKYEAVHRIQGSRDLERRLADDRRCYAFVHPALPDEPLIFTELALTHGMSSDARTLGCCSMVNYLYRRNNPRSRYDAATRMQNMSESPRVERLAGMASTLFSH